MRRSASTPVLGNWKPCEGRTLDRKEQRKSDDDRKGDVKVRLAPPRLWRRADDGSDAEFPSSVSMAHETWRSDCWRRTSPYRYNLAMLDDVCTEKSPLRRVLTRKRRLEPSAEDDEYVAKRPKVDKADADDTARASTTAHASPRPSVAPRGHVIHASVPREEPTSPDCVDHHPHQTSNAGMDQSDDDNDGQVLRVTVLIRKSDQASGDTKQFLYDLANRQASEMGIQLANYQHRRQETTQSTRRRRNNPRRVTSNVEPQESPLRRFFRNNASTKCDQLKNLTPTECWGEDVSSSKPPGNEPNQKSLEREEPEEAAQASQRGEEYDTSSPPKPRFMLTRAALSALSFMRSLVGGGKKREQTTTDTKDHRGELTLATSPVRPKSPAVQTNPDGSLHIVLPAETHVIIRRSLNA